MTLSNLRTIARAIVPGAKLAIVSNAVLDLILNRGVRDVAAYTICLKVNSTFNVTAETGEYILSTEVTDFLVPDKPGLWWNRGTAASPDWVKLYPKTLQTIDKDRPTWRDDDSDDPLDYSIEGDILTVVPKPDTTLASGFWLYHGRTPADMTAVGHFTFSGSTTEYANLSIFDDAILAYWEWKAQKIFNKGQDQYKLKETDYKVAREEAFNLFKRRPDISAHRDTRLQGRKIRS